MTMIYTKERQDELVANAARMMNNATNKWSTMYWTGVWKQLCIKFGKVD